MKVRKLTETHFERNDKFYAHHQKHTAKQDDIKIDDELFPPMSAEEYDKKAHLLSIKKVTTSNYDSASRYVGFVTDNDKIIKLDKQDGELVIYCCKSPTDANTLTYYKIKKGTEKERYNRLLKHYKRDITIEDDIFNT